MKMIKWVGHPVVLMILYLLLIVEGDEFGGFFMLYLLLSVPHLVPYALVALAGIVLMVFAFNFSRRQFGRVVSYFIGYALMFSALVIFFSSGNKWKTFELGIPLCSFILFGISSICFLVWLFSSYRKPVSNPVSTIS